MKLIKTIIIFIILISITTVSFAGQYAIDPGTFAPTYNTDISKVEFLGETVLGYIVNIAAISSVLIIAFLGLKFMLGSVEQRAEYKKSFMPLLIGMFVVLSAATITSVLWNLQEKCQHEYSSEPTCTNALECVLCGEKSEPLGHDFKEVGNKERCSRCGLLVVK